jgi:hypothetical protein
MVTNTSRAALALPSGLYLNWGKPLFITKLMINPFFSMGTISAAAQMGLFWAEMPLDGTIFA